jgi:tetrahydromethanopterin S-methyltransferase subunit G
MCYHDIIYIMYMEYILNERTYSRFRISNKNLEKIKARATNINQTVDNVISEVLQKLESYEKKRAIQ